MAIKPLYLIKTNLSLFKEKILFFMTTNTLFLILSFFVLIILLWIFIIEIRLKRIFAGFKVKNIESLISELSLKSKELDKHKDKINSDLEVINKRLDRSIRNIETERFNPFPEVGGNQSFSTSFLNDEGDGLILSGLYTRERMNLFAKPIIKGQSNIELTKEEENVLKKSLNKKVINS